MIARKRILSHSQMATPPLEYTGREAAAGRGQGKWGKVVLGQLPGDRLDDPGKRLDHMGRDRCHSFPATSE